MPMRIPHNYTTLSCSNEDATEQDLTRYAAWLARELSLVRAAIADLRPTPGPVTTGPPDRTPSGRRSRSRVKDVVPGSPEDLGKDNSSRTAKAERARAAWVARREREKLKNVPAPAAVPVEFTDGRPVPQEGAQT